MSGRMIDLVEPSEDWSRRRVLTVGGGLVASVLLVPEGAGALLVPEVGSPKKGQVAITFDDGPHKTVTDQVLKILQRRGVPATFFVMGMLAERYPNVIRRCAQSGHRVQSHTWNHQWLTGMSTDAIKKDLTKTSRTIKRLTGRTPTVFRPPYGATSTRVQQAAASLGLRQVMWNAGPMVTTTTSSSALRQTLQHVAAARQKGVGATILLHDGTGHTKVMLGMLDQLITELRKKNWQFVRYT